MSHVWLSARREGEREKERETERKNGLREVVGNEEGATVREIGDGRV